MTLTRFTKYPRLYVEQSLDQNASPKLETPQIHYLKNVLRMKEGDQVRFFNGSDGEWLGEVLALGKKDADIKLTAQTKPQPEPKNKAHLIFAPIKKQRMDFLVEKAVELGVTDFHPILTHHGEVRKVNTERITAQITEAAEQCERLDIPTLHKLETLEKLLAAWGGKTKITACLEYFDAPHISEITFEKDKAFIIGPAGGFEDAEKEMIVSYNFVQPADLGETLLRAETAALKCLSFIDRKP
ncbi:MAG: ribosomal RNA small subunit methyltransferase E [Micavibrio sp.]|nr:MAG: ribosomal RNA small subunit methyltransferase E [Micavibrio sp.]